MSRPTPEELRAKGLCRAPLFKDLDCGYQGPENWCDRTKARCGVLKNDHRFDLALPPIKEPFSLPWWTIISTLGMFCTIAFVPDWKLAGLLYLSFSLLLIPPARMALYYRYIRPAICWVKNKDTVEDM